MNPKQNIVDALCEKLKDMPRLISIKYFPSESINANGEEFVQVITWENMMAPNVVKIYHEFNLANLCCIEKLDDVEWNAEDKKSSLVDVYYFKFV